MGLLSRRREPDDRLPGWLPATDERRWRLVEHITIGGNRHLMLGVTHDLDGLWVKLGPEDPGFDRRRPTQGQMRLVLPVQCVTGASRELVSVGPKRNPSVLNRTTLDYTNPVDPTQSHQVSWLSYTPSALRGGYERSDSRYWEVTQYLAHRDVPGWLTEDELRRAEAAEPQRLERERVRAEQEARIDRISAETAAFSAEHAKSMRRWEERIAEFKERLDPSSDK